MKVLSVVGNRPQFIKSGPLAAALREAGIDEVTLHTGQHWDRELSEVFFEELGLPEPAYRLDLHTADAERMRPGIAAALAAERPDWALVFGDTNSTLAGTEAALDAGIPVAHVEAGLRSGDWSMPEERNRVAVDRVARAAALPGRALGRDAPRRSRSRADRGRRRRDGRRVPPARADRARALDRARAARARAARVRRRHHPPRGQRAAGAAGPDRATGSGGSRSRSSSRRTRATRSLLGELPANVQLIDPLGYLDMAALCSQARVIVTDSGGLQKEAYWYGVPCVTARPSTEWVDTVELGANVLVDDDPDALVAAVAAARMPDGLPQLYGDGNASPRVAAALRASLAPA